jgi:hypothetical protein
MENLSAIHRNGIIVRLNISMWEGRKYDKKVTAEIENMYASKDSGRWNKILIAQDAVKEYSSIAKEARLAHYRFTLPWGDNGDRILPVRLMDDYKATMNEIKERFNDQVRRFTEVYPLLIEEARARLNGMFNENDYPQPNRIGSKFDMEYHFVPVPLATDFRCEMSQDDLREIENKASEYHNRLAENAKRALWERIYYPVARIVERLSKSDATFRDSLIDNVWEVLQTLDVLNFDDDPRIVEAKQRIGAMLSGLSPEDIREERVIRDTVAGEATTMMNRIAEIINVDPKETIRKLRLERGLDEKGKKLEKPQRKIRAQTAGALPPWIN